MAKGKSIKRGNQIIFDENLIQILESFQPDPSPSFYNRMQKAPWTSRYRVARYALQVAILMAVIFAVILINPSGIPPLTSTNTPTSTPTMGVTNPSLQAPITTDGPPSENTTFLAPTRTPSN
jgi:hypothetical protein